MREKSCRNVYDEVDFKFYGIAYPYTPLYNLFDGVFQFERKPSEKVAFFCKVCKIKISVYVGKPGYLKKHLETHEESEKWLKSLTKYRNNPYITPKIDSKTLNIIKFFLIQNKIKIDGKLNFRIKNEYQISTKDFNFFIMFFSI